MRAHNPSFTNVQVRDRLQSTAVDLGTAGRDNFYGYGRLDLGAALGNGGSTPIASVSIDGPVCIYSAGSERFTAHVQGGTSPFQYAWYRDIAPYGDGWQGLGSGQSKWIFWSSGDYSARVRVRVTDADGDVREAIHTVQVLTGGNAAVAGLAVDDDSGGREAKMCAGGGGDPL